MTTATYTLGDIAAAHDVPLRTVQFWADKDVLIGAADRGGKSKGSPRRFPETEIKVASIAKRLAALNCPVSEIRDVVTQVRRVSEFATVDEVAAECIRRLQRQVEALRNVAEELTSANATRTYTRFDMLNGWFDLITLICFAGGSDGDVHLVITIYRESDDYRSRVIALPQSIDRFSVATTALHNVVGFKVVSLPVADLSLFGQPTEHSLQQLRQLLILVLEHFNNMVRGIAQRSREAEDEE